MAPPKTSGKRAKLWAGIKKGLSKLNCLKERSNVHAYTAISHGEKEGSTPLNRANAGDTITFGHSGVGMRGSDEWDALKDACGRNELQLEMVGDAIVVGNEKAFVMLDSVNDLKKEVRELRRAKAVSENRVAELEEKLRTNVIEQASGYAASRNKFVTALKLKTTEEVNEYDKRILADKATRAATGPDAVSDALLFMPLIRLRRVDVWFYRDLYGMEPAEVLRFKDHLPTITALEAYASVTTSRGTKPPSELRAHFLHFIHELRASGFDLTYLDGEATTVTETYWEFRRALSDEMNGSPSSKKGRKSVRFSDGRDSYSTDGNCGETTW